MATDIRTQGLQKPVDVAEYLFTRLYQIGIRSLHGLPGDFNLVALDYVPKVGIKWVGSVNELNAGMFPLSSPQDVLTQSYSIRRRWLCPS